MKHIPGRMTSIQVKAGDEIGKYEHFRRDQRENILAGTVKERGWRK